MILESKVLPLRLKHNINPSPQPFLLHWILKTLQISLIGAINLVKNLYLEHFHAAETTTIIAQTGHLHYPYFNSSHPSIIAQTGHLHYPYLNLSHPLIIAQTGHLHYPYFNLSHPLAIPLFARYDRSLLLKYSL